MPRKSILLLLCTFGLFTPKSVSAAVLPEDMNSAVAYAYFGIGSDEDYNPDLSIDSFRAQIDEIEKNGYTVSSISDVLSAQKVGSALPPKTIILTFENFDSAFVKDVLPILESRKFPFVLFLSAAKLDDAEQNGGFPSWDDVKPLLDNPKIEIGLLPYHYTHEHGTSESDLTLDLNRAKTRVREKLGIEPLYFSYPFGEYSPSYISIVSKAGFAAGMTQTSGVISASSDHMVLPRFTMTEGFSDIERFRMTSSALPLPISDVSPDQVYSEKNPPDLHFSATGGLTATDLSKMECFASGIGVLKKEISESFVKLVFPSPFEDGKGRINCTIPVPSPDNDPDALRWRWTGFQFSFPE